ncbi:hypothetical protein O3P69_001127 [Scylla paramamosain]|uniref:Uncharacterized protein n=1 Tax=Scylla paramamosain TaxID=85552 RepID=A0AAW0UQR7_SCYPA
MVPCSAVATVRQSRSRKLNSLKLPWSRPRDVAPLRGATLPRVCTPAGDGAPFSPWEPQPTLLSQDALWEWCTTPSYSCLSSPCCLTISKYKYTKSTTPFMTSSIICPPNLQPPS